MRASEQALVVRDLRKRYPKVEALKGVSIALPKGEIWGLLGPNGSGKSTLLKCVAGLLQPDGGEIMRFSVCRLPGRPRRRSLCT